MNKIEILENLKRNQKRNSGAEEYDNLNFLKITKGIQRQKKESVNLKIAQLKLLTLRKRKKRLKKSEQSLRDLWGSIKQTNIASGKLQKGRREREECLKK